MAIRDELIHLDTLDLYQARSRSSFIKATATELFLDPQIVKRDVGQMLLELERLQHQRIDRETAVAQPVEVSHDQRNLALQLLTDLQLANRLISEVMGQSLDDLLPQTRQLLVLIDNWVNRQARQQKCGRNMIRFSQRELRESFGWSDFQLRHHLARLVELEYVLAFRSGQGNGKLYQLLYDGEGRDGNRFVLGLNEVDF